MITVYTIVQLCSHKCCLQGSNSTLCGYRAIHFNYSYSRFMRTRPAVHCKFIYAQWLAHRNIIKMFITSDKNVGKENVCASTSCFPVGGKKKGQSQLRTSVFIQLEDLIPLSLNRQLITTSRYSTGINNHFYSIFTFTQLLLSRADYTVVRSLAA